MKFNGISKVISKKWLCEDVFQLTIQRTIGMGPIQAGQFFNIRSNEFGYPMLNRPISVSDFDQNSVEFTIKVLGEGTKSLSRFQEEDFLSLMGPLGNGFELLDAKKILLIGGGIGIAPLKKICTEEIFRDTEIDIILGFRDEPYMLESFKSHAKQMIVLSENIETYRKGYVTEPLEELINESKYDMIYSCGPQKMLKSVSEVLNKKGVRGQILMEEKMACGIGACLVCTCKTKDDQKGFSHKRMCKDGPMFYADEVIFDE